jgi:integrase
VDHRRAIERLAEFATAAGWLCTVETFDRRAAGQYASHLEATGTHPVTANKHLSSLSAFWKWMLRKGLAEGPDNPWRHQSLATPKSHRMAPEAAKRPFTDPELSRLLHTATPETTAGHLMSDFMVMAALSGMRINEIADLKVGDIYCEAGTARVTTAKTKAGVRVVPIHSDLAAIVARRTQGQGPAAWLFPELPEQNDRRGSERYMPVSNRFQRHRMRLGVHQQAEGQRQSSVDFHSFRRLFITKAEHAGVAPHIISAVVGHERKGMTLGVYSGGPSLDQLRQCIKAVRLPALSALFPD